MEERAVDYQKMTLVSDLYKNSGIGRVVVSWSEVDLRFEDSLQDKSTSQHKSGREAANKNRYLFTCPIS